MKKNVCVFSILMCFVISATSQGCVETEMLELGWQEGLYRETIPIWEERLDYFNSENIGANDFLVLEFGDSSSYSYIYLDLEIMSGKYHGDGKESGFIFEIPQSITDILAEFKNKNCIYDGTAPVRGGLLLVVRGVFRGMRILFASYGIDIDYSIKTEEDIYRKMNNDLMRFVLGVVDAKGL